MTKSSLDRYKAEIKHRASLGIHYSDIAQSFTCSPATMLKFMHRHKIKFKDRMDRRGRMIRERHINK